MCKGNVYALLSAVSLYDGGQDPGLMSGRGDLRLMESALTSGLRIPAENIRSLGESGRVGLRSFVRALSEFAAISGGDDTFLLYFSGHGSHDSLSFSDGALPLRDLSGFLSEMSPKAKVLILDCCHSGSIRVPPAEMPDFGSAIDDFAGRGIAVLASSSPDECSWMAPDGSASLYTSAVCEAMLSKRYVREGRLSLFDLSENVRENMAFLNREAGMPERQHPYFRAGMGGTVFFEVSGWRPYRAEDITLSGDGYELYGVKSISHGNVRRLAAFLMTEEQFPAPKTAEIAEEASIKLRDCGIFANEREAERFRGIPASVVWCYFGCGRGDMLENNYYARTVWAGDRKIRR